MKAAVFREVNVPMEIEEITISKPGPREVLIRTTAAGICHSDMHFTYCQTQLLFFSAQISKFNSQSLYSETKGTKL